MNMIYYLTDMKKLQIDIIIAEVTEMKYSVEKTIDGLGRVVLPKNIRDYYGISLKDKIYLIPTVDGILIKKSDAREKSEHQE